MPERGSSSNSQNEGWKQYLPYLPWVVGGFLILGGAGFIFAPQGNPIRSAMAGIIFIVIGLLAFPISRDWISARSGMQLRGWMVAGIVLGGVVIGGAILPPADSGGDAGPSDGATPSASPAQEVDGEGENESASETDPSSTQADNQTGNPPPSDTGNDSVTDGGQTQTPPSNDTNDSKPSVSANESTLENGQTTPPPENGTNDSSPPPTGDGPTSESGQLSRSSVTITDVVDGDTVDVRYDNGTTDTVRLLGVDAPETAGDASPGEFEGVPDNQAGADCLSEQAEIAASFGETNLAGETVQLRFDDQSDRRGSYGRLLAYVIVDGENVNYRLVSEGHARVYDTEFSQSDRFYSAESIAQSGNIGVWSCRDVQTADQPDGSSGGGSIAIAAIHADAPGNDHDNLNQEYIVFENTGNSSIDLSGWTISDEADHRFVLPQGTELGVGEQLTVYTGSGSNTDAEVYWGSSSAVWNNGGDTITVSNDQGTVLSESYS